MCNKTNKMAAVLLLTVLFMAQSAFAAPLRKVVETSHVCMVNNMDMRKPQLLVKVDGKDYFGCCKMCVETLNKDRKARFAVDPVSGKEVDKAKAVIGAKPDGEVLYFENEKNLHAFAAK